MEKDVNGKTVWEKIKDKASQFSSDVSETSQKIAHMVKNGVDTAMDTAKEAANNKKMYCFALEPDNTDDTESIISAVGALKEAGCDARVFVEHGTMCGYVLVKGKDIQKAVETVQSCGHISISDSPVDKRKADRIKRHS